MTCNENQTALAAGERGSKEHAAACAECAAYAADSLRLETLARQWRADAPDSALRNRIRAAVQSADPARSRSRSRSRHSSIRLRVAFAAACVLLIASVLVVGRSFDRSGASRVLADAAAAMTRITDVRITQYATDYTTNNDTVAHHFATLQEVEQQWYLPGVGWRKEGVWGSRLILIGSDADRTETYYRYDSATGQVAAEHETAPQQSDFSLASLLGSGYAEGGTALVGESTDASGKTLEELSVGDSPRAQHRSLCWIDRSTNLPARIDGQNRIGDGPWTTESRRLFDYNEALPRSLWNPATLKDEGWSQSGS